VAAGAVVKNSVLGSCAYVSADCFIQVCVCVGWAGRMCGCGRCGCVGMWVWWKQGQVCGWNVSCCVAVWGCMVALRGAWRCHSMCVGRRAAAAAPRRLPLVVSPSSTAAGLLPAEP
jgi:hypothetical protein